MSSLDFAAYDAKCARARVLAADVLPDNKAALFEALQAAGIHTVTVIFDGCGDSGQIESLAAFGTENTGIELPNITIRIKEVDFETSAIAVRERAVRDIVETMVYDFLQATHQGWENDDGAYGEFTFSTAQQTITLEYNERYTDTHYHEHEF